MPGLLLYKDLTMKTQRLDKTGAHRVAYEKNRKVILRSQDICGICGKPVDKKLKTPDPMSPAIDHIIPISKGGHPSDIDNMQLTHRACNRAKSDKLFKNKNETEPKVLGNRVLPQSRDWKNYKSE